jgi:uncharacterized protein (TIGR03067 family)
VTILAFSRDSTDDDLIGVWKLEWTQTNGQPKYRERELWVFRHGRLTIVRDGDAFDDAFTVDSSTTPKRMDLHKSFFGNAIYQVEGDALTVAQVASFEPRPDGFQTTRGDRRQVSVLWRLPADPRMPTAELMQLFASEFGPPIKYPDPMDFDAEADQFIYNLMRELISKSREPSGKEQVICDVALFEVEVDNGGFHQFFFNSPGDHALETAAALHRIGAPETAMLVQTACALFPNGKPSKDQGTRQLQLDEFTLDHLETLRDLEQRFYSRREDLSLLLKRYWQEGS